MKTVAPGDRTPRSGRVADLPLRAGSAVVMAVCALATAWVGGAVFLIFWTGVAALALREWLRLTARAPHGQLWGWRLSGIAGAVLLVVALWLIRRDPVWGHVAMFWIFAVVWSTDVGAFAVGRLIGGPKLMPRVSPHKTWSGSIGGIAIGAAGGFALAIAAGIPDAAALVLPAAALSVFTQGGDLWESALKRRFGVKDTGGLIPGHGGIMDRIDGFFAATVAAALLGMLRLEDFSVAQGLLLW